MTKLRLAILFASLTLATALLVSLAASAQIDLAQLRRSLSGVPPGELAEIVLLLAINNALSGEKWRLITARLHQDAAADMPRLHYFAFTSIGVALGQVVPAQLSLVFSRMVGAHFHGGRALSRGMAATLFDYFFDLLIAAIVAFAFCVALLAGGDPVTGALTALAVAGAGLLFYGSATRLVTTSAYWLEARRWRPRRFSATAVLSALLAPDLGRRLLAISALRFVFLVLINGISAEAISAEIPLWNIAASLPFAIIANALSITPGGLGVSEWAMSFALLALGISFQAAAQWVLVTRVLVAGAAVLCGGIGFLIVAVTKTTGSGRLSRRSPTAYWKNDA